MFLAFLHALRARGLPVSTGEWLAFLEALQRGLAVDLDELYTLGRAVLCRGEADFDRYDLAFADVFRDVDATASERLRAWLEAALVAEGQRVDPGLADEDLWRELAKRLAEQRERHDGGGYWVGTGGTSPFGHSGRASRGIRVGGPGGGRSAVRVATERRWANYRSDRRLDIRELQVVLRTLRDLRRDGRTELDLDGTIAKTARNAGEIELVERPERRNQVHLVLLMDAGGSMAPHAERVERLFSAAAGAKAFRSFTPLYFHNCVYGWLYRDFEEVDRLRTEDFLAGLGPKHRLIFVGDASMAPWELVGDASWGGGGPSGLDWLRRIRARCPASVWLNPDPRRLWEHPTVRAIGAVFPMYELTVEGLRDAVRKLRAPPV